MVNNAKIVRDIPMIWKQRGNMEKLKQAAGIDTERNQLPNTEKGESFYHTNLVYVLGRDVVVPEMSIDTIRKVIDCLIGSDEKNKKFDLVGGQLFEDISLKEIYLITGFDMDDMEKMTPGALRPLVDKIREINPDYIELRYRLIGLGGQTDALPWE